MSANPNGSNPAAIGLTGELKSLAAHTRGASMVAAGTASGLFLSRMRRNEMAIASFKSKDLCRSCKRIPQNGKTHE